MLSPNQTKSETVNNPACNANASLFKALTSSPEFIRSLQNDLKSPKPTISSQTAAFIERIAGNLKQVDSDTAGYPIGNSEFALISLDKNGRAIKNAKPADFKKNNVQLDVTVYDKNDKNKQVQLSMILSPDGKLTLGGQSASRNCDAIE